MVSINTTGLFSSFVSMYEWKYFLVRDKCCLIDNFIALVNAVIYNTVSSNGVIWNRHGNKRGLWIVQCLISLGKWTTFLQRTLCRSVGSSVVAVSVTVGWRNSQCIFFLLEIWPQENEDITFLRNVGFRLPSEADSLHRRSKWSTEWNS